MAFIKTSKINLQLLKEMLELIKSGGEELISTTIMHDMIVKIWNTELLPDEWLVGSLILLHKEG